MILEYTLRSNTSWLMVVQVCLLPVFKSSFLLII